MSRRSRMMATMSGNGTASVFNGDFGALASSYSLTVLSYLRGDLGVSGTQGTGKALWANQSGACGDVVPTTTGAANGIGSVGAGLNSRASVLMDAATQTGKYTRPALAAASVTPHHRYFVTKVNSAASGGAAAYSSTSDADLLWIASNVDANWKWGDDEPNTTGCVFNQWYRGRSSYASSVFGAGGIDRIRIGAHETAQWGNLSGSSAIGAETVYLGSRNDSGNLKVGLEWLLSMEIQGTLANFLAFAADADTKVQAFWTTAIEI